MADEMNNRADMIMLTKDECESLLDWLEIHFIDDIRNDTDADSMEWLSNMVSIYNKCKEVAEHGN